MEEDHGVFTVNRVDGDVWLARTRLRRQQINHQIHKVAILILRPVGAKDVPT